MPGADPEHMQNRLDVAASFPRPIRTYTANGTKAGDRGAASTSRRHQLKRGR